MQGENKTILWIIGAVVVVIVIALIVLLLSRNNTTQTNTNTTPPPTTTPPANNNEGNETPVTPATKTFNLAEQNDSGQNGSVTFEEVGDDVRVTINVMNANAIVTPEPAHIHVGSCPNPGSVVYPLTDLVYGTSVTMLENVSFEDLASQEPLAVNVHKSAAESSVYYSCGDLEFE